MNLWYIEWVTPGFEGQPAGKAMVTADNAIDAIGSLKSSGKAAVSFETSHVTLVGLSKGVNVIQQSDDIPF